MTPAPPQRRAGRRPARVTVAGTVLVVQAALTLLFSVLSFWGALGVGQFDGTERAVTPEIVAGALAQASIPLGLTLTAGAAAIGVLQGRRWGRPLALAAGAILLLGGFVLLWIVLRELGLPGSFAVLAIPPAILFLAVGAFVTFAAGTSGRYFDDKYVA